METTGGPDSERQCHPRYQRRYGENWQLKQRVEAAAPQSEENTDQWFDRPMIHTDVFISYSRADAEITQRLYETLTAEERKQYYLE